MGNVIITGANRGIGKALLERYAKGGWNVWACARRVYAEFASDCTAIQDRYHIWIRPVYFDLSDTQQIKSGIKQILSDKQDIDALVNNAGVGIYDSFQNIPVDRARDVFNINFFAPYQITQYVLRKMIRQKRGNIVNISSTASLEANGGVIVSMEHPKQH